MKNLEDLIQESEFRNALRKVQGFSLKSEQAEPKPIALEIPQELNREFGDYDIIELIGSGGMGVIFKAIHRDLGKVVAIKSLSDTNRLNAGAADRFLREIKAVGQLNHPNILQATDARTTSHGERYLVTEFLEGLNLSTLVNTFGPLPVPAACEIVRQIACGLEHAHGLGIVHRDIKPLNVWLTPTGVVKILDFGLAKSLTGDATENLTHTDQVVGTVDYISPEQIDQSNNIDSRTDSYALGCLFYFLITGKAPYSHLETVAQKVVAHVRDPIPRLSAQVNSASVQTILDRMTEKDPECRYQSVSDIQSELIPLCSTEAWANFVAKFREEWHQGRSAPALLDTNAKQLPTRESLGQKKSVAGIPKPVKSAEPTRNWNSWRSWLIAAAFATAILLGILITIQTDKGTLVIEAEDGVAVEFLNDELTIRDTDTNKSFVLTLEKPLVIKEGEYEISSTENYEMLVRDPQSNVTRVGSKFQIKRGENTRVKITLKNNNSSAVASSSPKSETPIKEFESLDAELAHWTIAANAPLQVQGSNGGGLHITDTDQLPENGYKVTVMDVRGKQAFNDQMAALAAKLSGLVAIHVGATSMTDAGIAELAKSQSLQVIEIGTNAEPLSDIGIAFLSEMKGLRKLQLHVDELDLPSLRRLSKMHQLENLNVRGKNVTDVSIRWIAEMPNLKYLFLEDTEISDSGIKTVCEMKSLQRLWISGCPKLTDEAFKTIAQNTELEELWLNRLSLGDQWFQYLEPSHIENLRIANIQLDENILGALSKMQRLEKLAFYEALIDEQDLEDLSHFSRLTYLEFSYANANDDSIAKIALVPRLETLFLSGPGFTKAALESLRQEKPRLTIHTLE